MAPLLTIVIPTHNRADYLARTLEICRKECSPRVEVIVVDDASTDRTLDSLRRQFPQFQVVANPVRRGPGPARNLGLEKACGRYFLPVDSDCLLLRGALAELERRLEGEQPDILFFPCRSWPAGRRSTRIRGDQPISCEDLLTRRFGELIPVVSIELLRRHNLRYPDFRCGAERLLWLDVLRIAAGRFVDRELLEYRTDVPMRISSPEFQVAHAAEVACAAEAFLPRFDGLNSAIARAGHARQLLSAGTYRVLAGQRLLGRQYLLRSWRLGSRMALLPWLASYLPLPLTRIAYLKARHLEEWVLNLRDRLSSRSERSLQSRGSQRFTGSGSPGNTSTR
ncbi:MAG: glycosyltransferase family 2 protein [Armatimonadetes bacterium]|nr:glycosyltransferase family 2 protein [Armatimonadota bacterium]